MLAQQGSRGRSRAPVGSPDCRPLSRQRAVDTSERRGRHRGLTLPAHSAAPLPGSVWQLSDAAHPRWLTELPPCVPPLLAGENGRSSACSSGLCGAARRSGAPPAAAHSQRGAVPRAAAARGGPAAPGGGGECAGGQQAGCCCTRSRRRLPIPQDAARFGRHLAVACHSAVACASSPGA